MCELNSLRILQHLPSDYRKIYIAYSGGMDSQVLLHLCASVPDLTTKTTAVYIHHGLQKVADDWLLHCSQQCNDLSIDFKSFRVNARCRSGESPEESARNARYSILKELLLPNDVLLLAHHREDQMETVLLQLFRGSGVSGLAAMPVIMPFGTGILLRPFLNISKEDIRKYAISHRLNWVDDPTNQTNEYDRNYLRNCIVPSLRKRWPSLDKTVSRSAVHCGDAAKFLQEWVDHNLQEIVDPAENSMLIEKWSSFGEIHKAWLLRAWLLKFITKPPSQSMIENIVKQVIHANDRVEPHFFVQGFFIKKYRGRLFCINKKYFLKENGDTHWLLHEKELQMQNGFRLIRVDGMDYGLDKQLWDSHLVTVVQRRGGEKIKLPGRNGHHCLKKLYQEAGIPPWERRVRPLIYFSGRLAAIAGLWVDEWAYGREKRDCYHVLWQI